MPNFICVNCGVQYAESEAPPESCVICEDERQYVRWAGQEWTTLEEMAHTHRNRLEEMEPGLTRIGTEPAFAIGQHAHLVQSPDGNVLWDCTTLIGDETVEAIDKLGGISCIAISHPHFYSTSIDWSRAFGDAPIYLHAADRRWVMRPDPAIVFWEEETKPLGEGLTLIRGGGHFEGGTILHWPAGAEGRGVLLPGDIIAVVYDNRWVTFMRSFPNYIPLPAFKVREMVRSVEPFEFDRIYSPWEGRVLANDAKAAVQRSAERYIRAISE